MARASSSGATDRKLLSLSVDFRTAGFVRGGIGRLGEAIAHAAKASGAEIRTDSTVLQIVTEQGRTTGVVLENGDRISAGLVLSNADVKRTFLKLVEPTYVNP